MRIKSKGFVRTALAAAVAAGLLLPSAGYSLGVGKVQVRSALNQRLNAELELFSVKANDLANLIVKISTQALAGNVSSQASNFDYSVETRRGRYYLKLFSKQPVREPLLNFLIELEWPQGRLLRELAIFLDPPASSADPTLTAGLPPKTPSKAKPTAQRIRPNQDSDSRSSSQPGPSSSQTPSEIVGNYGPVARGETLWRIADGLRPDGVSVQQMMQALYSANPRAFSKPGLDHLMAGVTLQVPSMGGATPRVAAESRSSTSSSPRAEERVEVRLVPPSEQEVASQTASLPGSASTEQEGGPARLRIASLRDLQTQVQTAQSDEPEVLVAQSEPSSEATVSDASASDTEVTGPISEPTATETLLDTSRLVAEETSATETPPPSSEEISPTETLVQTDPALPQQTEQIGASSEAETTTVETTVPATPSAESTASATPEAAGAETPSTETPVVAETASSQEQPAESQPAVAAVEASRDQPSAPGLDIVGMLIKLQNDPAGVWDDIQRHPLGLPIAGGVLIVLLLLIAMVSRRSRKAEDYTEIDRDLALSAAAARANEATQIVRRSSAEQQAETAARMRLQRVDFLIAGGSYQEAEKVLRRALSENPFDLNVKEKMLDVYYKSRNADQFITVAESIRSQVDDEHSPLWQKVVKQGRRIYPGHPLFELTSEEDTIIFTSDTGGGEGKGANDDDATRIVADHPAEPERGVVLDFGATRTTPVLGSVEDDTRVVADDTRVVADADLDRLAAEESDTPGLEQLNEWSNSRADEANAMSFSGVAEEDADRASDVDEFAIDEQELQFDFDTEDLAVDADSEEDDVTMRFDVDQIDLGEDTLREANAELSDAAHETDAEQMDFDLETLSFADETPSEFSADDQEEVALPGDALDDQAIPSDMEEEQPDEEDTRLISAALDGDTTQVMEVGDYVEIKLDLANAYLEMQDRAGAVSLLEEVVNEGSAQQQTRARELLAQIGR